MHAPIEPVDAQPDDLDALRVRVQELETEIKRRDQADADGRTRRKNAATFAGEIAVSAVAGADVKGQAERFWDAWRSFGKRPSSEPLPERETRDLAVSVLARLTRVRLVYVLAAAIPSAFILAQTILLYQQNARFDRQNNLIAFEQTSSLRSLFFASPYDSLGRPVVDYLTIPDSLLYSGSAYFWPQPNQSSIDQVLAFARSEPEIAFSALLPLVRDDAPPVAVGSLIVLGQLRKLGLTDSKVVSSGARLADADLSGLNLRLSSLQGSDLRNSNLRGTDLTGAILLGATLDGANLRDAAIEHSDLSRASLIGVDALALSFYGSDLSGTRFDSADLNGASFNGAWLENNSFAGAELLGADFNEGNLVRARFDSTDLTGADFSSARLDSASFRRARLLGAIFQGARVAGADFTSADLRATNLDQFVDLRTAASVRGAYITRGYVDFVGDEPVQRYNSDQIMAWALGRGATTDSPPTDSLCCKPLAPPSDPGPPPPPPRPRRNPPKR